jgi:N-acetyl-gamma-glutamylphosphate reductase
VAGLSRVYGQEPFVRLVRERQGVYRYPEPKILAGSNYADVGFDYDPQTGRIVAIAAIDNLMKGAAGHGCAVHEPHAGLGRGPPDCGSRGCIPV